MSIDYYISELFYFRVGYDITTNTSVKKSINAQIFPFATILFGNSSNLSWCLLKLGQRMFSPEEIVAIVDLVQETNLNYLDFLVLRELLR